MKLAMILINKLAKLCSQKARMHINDRFLIKQILLIGFSSDKCLLEGVNIVLFSNDHNIFSSLIYGFLNNLPGPLSSNF